MLSHGTAVPVALQCQRGQVFSSSKHCPAACLVPHCSCQAEDTSSCLLPVRCAPASQDLLWLASSKYPPDNGMPQIPSQPLALGTVRNHVVEPSQHRVQRETSSEVICSGGFSTAQSQTGLTGNCLLRLAAENSLCSLSKGPGAGGSRLSRWCCCSGVQHRLGGST